MIRPAIPEDSARVSALGVAAGMFSAEDTGVTDAMMAGYFAGHREAGHVCLVAEAAGPGPAAAVAYAEPVRATTGTAELLMIAVDPEHQGRGLGGALLASVEEALRARGGRLLLVQTAGTADFAPARAFYSRHGYLETARVDDYYAPGVPMVMFCKSLGSAAAP